MLRCWSSTLYINQFRIIPGSFQEAHLSYTVVNQDDLQNNGSTAEFEGYLHGDTDVSFILVDMQPGESVRLHKHPYKEIFIVQEGVATYVVGTATLEAQAGQIIIAPADTPHKFVNSGEGPLRQVDIHLSKRFITEWLED
jgi:mannose-6-phosphate isomerase-like protein (cupin superfamily)